MLVPETVGTNLIIRHRLLTILLLGVVTSALSLTALVHLLTTSTRQRVDRAREGVAETIDCLADDCDHGAETSSIGYIAMRGGVLARGAAVRALPADWTAALERLVASDPAGPTVNESTLSDGTLVLGVRPLSDGSQAWAGVLVRPLPALRTWRWIVVLLALATALLCATSLYAVVTVHRGAGALRASLEALARNLDAPVPRPRVRELNEVAEGIAHLAQRLSESRKEQDRLSANLAHNERLAALGRVVAGVAHEVRNPLASIKLRLDLVSTGAELPRAVVEAIRHASSEIARLDRLVADLLMAAGRATGPVRQVSLGHLLRGRAEALLPWSQERGVEITCGGDAPAFVDPDAVGRAIDNLLRNAVEASPPGSEVHANVAMRGDFAEVSVVDCGAGVTDDRVPYLFEPFFTTKSEGTGLGLPISRAIARAHGGELLYSRANELTCFALRLSRPDTGSLRS